jgi:hypothetical protein
MDIVRIIKALGIATRVTPNSGLVETALSTPASISEVSYNPSH